MWSGAYCLTYYLSYNDTDQRPCATAEPKMPACMHCFSLSRCFYCLGYTAHHKATNTACQPNEECVIRGLKQLLVDIIDSIILILFHCSYKTFFII